MDYDDDEDDEDYKPPPRRQTDASDGDEGTLEALSVKRKIANKEEAGLVKKQRLDKISKSKESVFAALCSTLSQTVLPNKKAASVAHNASHSSNTKRTVDKNNHQEKDAEVVRNHSDSSSSSGDDNGSGENIATQIYSDAPSKSRENGQLEGEEHPHLPTNSSSEMVVNGS